MMKGILLMMKLPLDWRLPPHELQWLTWSRWVGVVVNLHSSSDNNDSNDSDDDSEQDGDEDKIDDPDNDDDDKDESHSQSVDKLVRVRSD